MRVIMFKRKAERADTQPWRGFSRNERYDRFLYPIGLHGQRGAGVCGGVPLLRRSHSPTQGEGIGILSRPQSQGGHHRQLHLVSPARNRCKTIHWPVRIFANPPKPIHSKNASFGAFFVDLGVFSGKIRWFLIENKISAYGCNPAHNSCVDGACVYLYLLFQVTRRVSILPLVRTISTSCAPDVRGAGSSYASSNSVLEKPPPKR